jgi:phenylacetate-CoA ligase
MAAMARHARHPGRAARPAPEGGETGLGFSANVVRHLIAPLWEHRDGIAYRSHLRFLERSQFWGAEELARYRRDRLNRILRHAHVHVPFHRRRLDTAGYDPAREWDIADLRRLPVLEKEDIRGRQSSLIATDADQASLRRKRTGGSTAVPLRVAIDPEGWNRKYAATWRHNRWAGFEPGEWLGLVWGNEPPPEGIRAKLRRFTYERFFALDTLHMTEANMQRFLAECRERKTRFLMGHAHSVYLLADFCRRCAVRDVAFDGVITSAMVLRPAERTVIEEVFAAEVFDRYGCEELSIIASECERHEGLHLHAEGLIAEVLAGGEPAPDGTFGDLVLTDLVNMGMPLLRYRVGDVAAVHPEPCACGRGLPRLTEIRGRTADFLHTPEGNRVFGISVLDTMMIHIEGIRQTQIVQNRIDELIVRLAVDPERFGAHGEAELRRELPKYFGPRMHYRFEFVERIAPEPNGKYRFAVCNLPEAGT